MTHSGRQTADDALAVALAAGKTVRDAAASAGVSEPTAFRRLRNPKFRRRVCQLRADVVGRAVGQMADAMGESATALRALLSSESELVRLAAAKAVLDLAGRLWKDQEQQKRIEELEDTIGGIKEDLERGKNNP